MRRVSSWGVQVAHQAQKLERVHDVRRLVPQSQKVLMEGGSSPASADSHNREHVLHVFMGTVMPGDLCHRYFSWGLICPTACVPCIKCVHTVRKVL